MKKQIVRLTESQLRSIVNESVNKIIKENEENEGFWGGIKNAAKAGYNKLAGKEEAQTAKWTSNPSMSQSYRNGSAAGDIQKASDLLYKNYAYLQKMGMANAIEVINQLEDIANGAKRGGVRSDRDNGGRFGKRVDYNVDPNNSSIAPTRQSNVRPGTTYSV